MSPDLLSRRTVTFVNIAHALDRLSFCSTRQL